MDKATIISFLKSHKKEFENTYQIMQIGLFGSYAIDRQREDSDIDIVYKQVDGHSMGYFQLIKFENILRNQFKKNIDLVNYRYMNPIIKYKVKDEIIYV